MHTVLHFALLVMGVLIGVALHAVWDGPRWGEPAEPPRAPGGWSPPTGTAVLLDAEGVEVSRRTLRQSRQDFHRPHGHGAAERFVYIGPRDGVHVFQVRRNGGE